VGWGGWSDFLAFANNSADQRREKWEAKLAQNKQPSKSYFIHKIAQPYTGQNITLFRKLRGHTS